MDLTSFQLSGGHFDFTPPTGYAHTNYHAHTKHGRRQERTSWQVLGRWCPSGCLFWRSSCLLKGILELEGREGYSYYSFPLVVGVWGDVSLLQSRRAVQLHKVSLTCTRVLSWRGEWAESSSELKEDRVSWIRPQSPISKGKLLKIIIKTIFF